MFEVDDDVQAVYRLMNENKNYDREKLNLRISYDREFSLRVSVSTVIARRRL